MSARIRSVLIWVLIAAAPACVQARMYQWVSPATSTPQLSGEPPPWYRSSEGGPRVQVYENGNLVDDTAIALPAGQREELRSAAFREAEERERAEVLKRLEQAALREERRRAARERIAAARARDEWAEPGAGTALAGGGERAEPAAAVAPREAPGAAVPKVEELDGDAVARLKAIIAEYDRRGGGSAVR